MKKIEASLEEKARRSAMVKSGLGLASCPTETHLASSSTQSLDLRRKGATDAKKRREAEERQWVDPDEIPVIIIDGYMSREKGPHAKELWTFLADWAAVLVENHIAHVVFLTNNVSASKPLSKALPNMTFETIVLADATLESALEFVYKYLDRDEFPDLIESVQTIGGRLTDLELFVQKVKSGMQPKGKELQLVSIFRSG